MTEGFDCSPHKGTKKLGETTNSVLWNSTKPIEKLYS